MPTDVKNLNANFYDIESLNNVFSIVNYDAPNNSLDIYYLIDNNDTTLQFDPRVHYNEIRNRIWSANRNFNNGNIMFYDLSDKNVIKNKLIPWFGLSDAGSDINNIKLNIPDNQLETTIPRKYWPICITDPNYNETQYPYIMGYNSFNYDSVMMALFFDECRIDDTGEITANITAEEMRKHNDQLFTNEYKSNMPSYLNPSKPPFHYRRSWIVSGRHIDIARLNEKQRHVGLKRLLGQLGYQILESDKLGVNNNTIETLDEFFDLIAYNVSDCINLCKLFQHPYYQGQFSTKKGMLDQYPELVYTDTNKTSVRRNPFVVDTSSAQFATRTLSPYGHLTDIETVSFLYPEKDIADKLGIEQTDVLDDSLKFMEDNFGKDSDAYKTFYKNIYSYYNDIRGKNFNNSENYKQTYTNLKEHKTALSPYSISEIPTRPNCIPYYNKDGSPSSCFVTFSTGGIHGCEYNKALYEKDITLWEKDCELREKVKACLTPLELVQAKKIEDAGKEYSATYFLKASATINGQTLTKSQTNLRNLTPEQQQVFWKDKPAKPQLFIKASTKKDNHTTKLNPKYVYTSSDPANHEDFTSYYPNLLRNMQAFYNPHLGYDRYGEVFNQKEKFGKLMKDESIPAEQRAIYKVQREGTKLLLNSASGAADATFDNDILMNNRIISMRIVGQLFTWRIGQAQTLAGGKITSTNTDGLYCVMEKEKNNKTLAENSKAINVEIEPEPMYLISKDANNRVEFSEDLSNILSTGGHDLSCNSGPNPTQSLDHPSILDSVLVEYLKIKRDNLTEPFDKDLAKTIFDNINSNWTTLDNKRRILTLYQSVVASSPSAFSYVFKTNSNANFQSKNMADYAKEPCWAMQHYNRIFLVRNNSNNNAYHLYRAANAKITPATKIKRAKDGLKPINHNPIALKILKQNGIACDSTGDREAKINVVSNLDPAWWVIIDNSDIHTKTDTECDDIFNQLNFDKYIELLKKKYENNWRNAT